MALPLSEWDQIIAPRLHKIEDVTQHIAYMAAEVRMEAVRLPSRPDWETKAEQNINEAIKSLENIEKDIHMAKHHLVKAQEAYRDKPVGE